MTTKRCQRPALAGLIDLITTTNLQTEQSFLFFAYRHIAPTEWLAGQLKLCGCSYSCVKGIVCIDGGKPEKSIGFI